VTTEFGLTTSLFAVDTDDGADTPGSAGSAGDTGALGFDVTSFAERLFTTTPATPAASAVPSGFLSAVGIEEEFVGFADVVGVRRDPDVLGGFASASVFLPVTLPVTFVGAAAVWSLSSDGASDADDPGPADVADPELLDEPAVSEGPDLSPVVAPPWDESDGFEDAGSAHATPWPVNTAAPTPRATASPPIRPMYLEEFTASPRVGDDCSAGRYARRPRMSAKR
jgi:hypothetical protein